MNTTTTQKHRIAALLSVIGALLILGGTAQAATSKPARMSNAEYRALMLRSKALNEKYHLGTYSEAAQGTAAAARRALLLRSQALNEKYHLGTYSEAAQGTTAAARRALMLRSQALNEKYQLGAFAPATRVGTAAAGFSWLAFGIGAAAMLGLVLLASSAIVGGRHGRRTPRTRTSS
jgi:hypothetical protein